MAALYYDLGSPYAYLTVMRTRCPLEPVLLGAIFRARGHGSWSQTAARERNVEELERRARAYGLPLVWPPGWPPDTLAAMRVAVWAERRGEGRAFAERAFTAAFAHGEPLDDPGVLRRLAPGATPDDPAIKADLRARTDAAIARGVVGVPTLATDDGTLVYGDDRIAAG